MSALVAGAEIVRKELQGSQALWVFCFGTRCRHVVETDIVLTLPAVGAFGTMEYG